jgi:hypothetical protein
MKEKKLLQLIKSMTMSEKRFFKIYSSRHIIGNNNNYIELFNYIDKHKTEDKSILNKLAFVKYLSAEKRNLYFQILKSLKAYHAQGNTKMKLLQQIEYADILFTKGLYNNSVELLIKCSKEAYKSEQFSIQYIVNDMLYDIAMKEYRYKDSVSITSEIKKTDEYNINLNYFKELAGKIYYERLVTGNIRTVKQLNNLKKIAQTKVKPISQRAQLFYDSVLLAIAFAERNITKEVEIGERIIKRYESYPFLIEYSPTGHLSSLYNLANSYESLEDYNKVLKIIDKIEKTRSNKFHGNNMRYNALAFIYSTDLKLYTLIKIEKYELALKLSSAIEDEIKKYKDKVPVSKLYDVYFLLCKLFIYCGKYKKALFYSNELLNDLQFKFREDIMSVIRILNLIIHTELGNNLTTEYLSNSTLKFLQKKNRIFNSEKSIIKTIKQNDKSNSYSVLRKELSVQKKNPFEATLFELFDFELWAKAKANKCTVSDL